MNTTARRLLIVDDAPFVAEVLSEALTRAGYECVTARSGATALEAADGEWFRAAIVDVRLPDMSGIRLVDKLKLLQPSLPVLVITGDAENIETADELAARTRLPVLRKPFRPEELVARLATLLADASA